MIDLSIEAYQWVKVLHIIFVISWMAGLLYLPRLFVYHAGVDPASETSTLFKTMELRLYHWIMMPAMVLSWGFGTVLVLFWGFSSGGWLHAKLSLAVLMTIAHFMLGYWRKGFLKDQNIHSARFYRYINEVPTILMILIVIVIIIKPF